MCVYNLEIGQDIDFVGEPVPKGDTYMYSFKAISKKAIKMFTGKTPVKINVCLNGKVLITTTTTPPK